METWLCRKSYYKTTDIYLSRLLEFCKRSLIWPESNRKIKNLTENNCIIAFNYSRTTLVCFRHHNPDPDFSQVPINSDSFNEIPDCEVYYVSISLQTKNGTHISIPFREEYPGKCQFHDITSGSIWLLSSCVIFTSETRSKKKKCCHILEGEAQPSFSALVRVRKHYSVLWVIRYLQIDSHFPMDAKLKAF